MANPTDKKYQPNWEGPYTVVRVGTVESYALSIPDGTIVPTMWNVVHLNIIINVFFEDTIINKEYLLDILTDSLPSDRKSAGNSTITPSQAR